MRTLKFMLLHILVDCLFVYAILKVVYYWVCGNVILNQIMPFTILMVFIAIGLYNVRSQGLIRSIADVALGFFMFIFYRAATINHLDILQSDLFFIIFIRGCIGLALGLGAFTLFRKFICSYLKAAQIYCISQEGDAGIIGSLFGAILRFKFTASVPVFNSIIHKIFEELFDAICNKPGKSNTPEESNEPKESNAADEVKVDSNTKTNPEPVPHVDNNNSIIDRLQNTSIVKASKGMLKIYINYLDECVLAYCYRYPDKGLFKGSVEAIQLALIHSVSLIGKIAILVFLNMALKIILTICYIIFIVKYIHFQFVYLVLSFIAVKCIAFILDDAVCEPLLMSGILEKFCSYELTNEDEKSISVETLKSLIPSFSKLDKFKSK